MAFKVISVLALVLAVAALSIAALGDGEGESAAFARDDVLKIGGVQLRGNGVNLSAVECTEADWRSNDVWLVRCKATYNTGSGGQEPRSYFLRIDDDSGKIID